MGVPKRLTEMQQRFAEFLVFGGPEGPMTQGEAAIAAGYSPNVQDKKDQNLCNPKVITTRCKIYWSTKRRKT
jgi:phage terminase small subunit